MKKYHFAIVRPPGESYLKALSSTGESKNVDLEKALYQHTKYIKALKQCGLQVIKLAVDENFPDGCFVQDPALVYGQTALVVRSGAPSRRGEEQAIEKVLWQHGKKIKRMEFPATMDGGDVMFTSKAVFVGHSQRTNLEGINQFKKAFHQENLPEVKIVPIEKGLHLLTGTTYLGDSMILISDIIEKSYFKEFKLIEVSPKEAYAANCLILGKTVLMPQGYPHTRKQLLDLDFEIIELEMSEFKKADGGVTCLSLLF